MKVVKGFYAGRARCETLQMQVTYLLTYFMT